jgi:hypothetical protein
MRILTTGPVCLWLSTLFVAGCTVTQAMGGGAAEPLVRHHAEIDLDCPNDEIRVEEELGGRYKAVGCGRKAVYQTACEALACEVRPESDPAIPWKDRPDPSDPVVGR